MLLAVLVIHAQAGNVAAAFMTFVAMAYAALLTFAIRRLKAYEAGMRNTREMMTELRHLIEEERE